MLHRVAEEIGVDEDGVRRDQGRVVLVEERGGYLGDFADDVGFFGEGFLFYEGLGCFFLVGFSVIGCELVGMTRLVWLDVR